MGESEDGKGWVWVGGVEWFSWFGGDGLGLGLGKAGGGAWEPEEPKLKNLENRVWV